MSFDRAVLYVFYAVLMTTVSGSLYLMGWMLLRRHLANGHERMLLRYLRIGGLFYLLPVMFIFVLLRWGDQGLLKPWLGKRRAAMSVFGSTPQIIWAVAFLFFLWCIFAGRMIVRWKREREKLIGITQNSLLENQYNAYICYRKMKKRLGIDQDFLLVTSRKVSSPCMTKYPQWAIILPSRSYTDSELEVIFAHEFMHYKRHDLAFKKMFLWINLIHALNPLAYLMRQFNKEYSELACDISVCCGEKAQITVQKYTNTLLEIAIKDGQIWNDAVAVTEKIHPLMWRIYIVKVNEKGRKLKKRMVALITALLVMGSSMTAYAAGNGIVKLQMGLVTSMMEITEVEPCWVNTLTEEFISAEEFAGYEAGGVITDGSVPFVGRSGQNINVSITVGAMYESGWFDLSEGQTVTVQICTTPENQLVQVGLKYKDGSAVAVTGTEPSHRFTASQSGSYQIFVRNLSNQPITAYGFYKRD